MREWKRIMKLVKYTIWTAAAAIAFAAAVPAGATWNSDNRGSVKGWGSSGWGSSGWGSSGSSGSSGSGGTTSSTGGTGSSGGSSSGGTPVPEPSNLMMLGLGLVGLIGGRLVARRRKKA
tara:strand:- start:1410 stop:1766 length:357 start_codon:yes stop_codon:yes gene_type:complete